MPYYDEYFEGTTIPSSFNTGGGTQRSSWVQESTWMRGYRTRPHSKALASNEVLDFQADPYAFFLDSASERSYRTALQERGLPYQGSPDKGHAWEMRKHTLHGSQIQADLYGEGYTGPPYKYSLYNPVPDPGYLTLDQSYQVLFTPPSVPSGLETFAQQAYARTAPSAVVFDAAQFLGELREGLPKLAFSTVQSGARFYKGLGSDYLNVEFGWKPFLNDLIKMGQALSGATSILKGQNSRVHRRYALPTRYESWNAPVSYGASTFGWYGLRGQVTPSLLPDTGKSWTIGINMSGTAIRTRETTRWFEGEFTNFMPLGFNPDSYLERLNALVNVRITPATLWELAPWSWLVDWYLKIGDTIKANENAANDKLIMHYGYAMEKMIQRDLLSVDMTNNPRTVKTQYPYSYWVGLPTHGSWVSEYTVKRRIRANPYGFRVGGAQALSGSQLAILGALGLTKTR